MPKIRYPARALNSRRRARLANCCKQGWKPERTIIYCFWDGEEPGLLGSTEWAETHADELKQARRRLHQLRRQRPRLISARKGRIRWRTSSTRVAEGHRRSGDQDERVWKRRRLADILARQRQGASEIRSRADLRIAALGSGSDYTVFLDHLGIASVNLGYSGEDEGVASITRSTTISIGTRIFGHGFRLRPYAGRKPPAP